MRYEFRCPYGHTVDLSLPIAERDSPRDCPEHRVLMKRLLVPPMAVQWEGHFANRFAKVRDGEW